VLGQLDGNVSLGCV